MIGLRLRKIDPESKAEHDRSSGQHHGCIPSQPRCPHYARFIKRSDSFAGVEPHANVARHLAGQPLPVHVRWQLRG